MTGKVVGKIENKLEALLKEIEPTLRVNPLAGQVVWAVSHPDGLWEAGGNALTDTGGGYSVKLSPTITIPAEKLVWWWKHGKLPTDGEITYIDGNKYNLAIENLMLVSSTNAVHPLAAFSAELREKANKAHKEFQEWASINVIGTKSYKDDKK